MRTIPLLRHAAFAPAFALASVLASALAPGLLAAQQPAARPARPAAARTATAPGVQRSAPVSNIRYEVTFDTATARERSLRVAMTFDVAGSAPVLLSLPTWTPGAYDVSNFARKLSNFTAAAGDRQLDWDKTDPDTWRIQSGGAKSVTVAFDFLADSLDNAMAWTRPDFAFFNGTNVFLYPEGRGFDFPATVTIRTQPDWKVATGMHRAPASTSTSASAPNTFRETNYHDLVDMPVFVGRIDVDSNQVEGKWQRLATYPAGFFGGAPRSMLWDQLRRMTPPQVRVFGEQPWTDYTTLIVFEPSYGGGSALEHQSSHLGIYNPQFAGTPILASITAHEMFHAWNVKRLRPAEMVPYDYEARQPTTLLWVSEGITDYYADLALVRGGIIDSTQFLALTTEKIQTVNDTPPVALEDASLSTWISPTDGTAYIYYPKGSLAGFMLDVLIRDGSDNRRSLDDVMRELYRTTYKQGRGFTTEQFLAAAGRAAGGRSFADFYERYIDGREPFPWDSLLPLAGLRLQVDSVRTPRLGIQTTEDSSGVRVMSVLPDGAAGAAGVKAGDQLVSVGSVQVKDPSWSQQFQRAYATQDSADLPIVVRRDSQDVTLNGKVRLVTVTSARIDFLPGASPKAVRVRDGIMHGQTTGS